MDQVKLLPEREHAVGVCSIRPRATRVAMAPPSDMTRTSFSPMQIGREAHQNQSCPACSVVIHSSEWLCVSPQLRLGSLVLKGGTWPIQRRVSDLIILFTRTHLEHRERPTSPWVGSRHWECFVVHQRRDPRTWPDAGLSKMNKKSRTVLKALSKGHSCEQILARDRSLTSHDIFHALSEAPTSHWRKKHGPQREAGRSAN